MPPSAGAKTRERILECALGLFNEHGEPNVTPVEVASQLGISPGNLYYHYHGKEPLILGLFEVFQQELRPLLRPPAAAQLGAEDSWLFLHLVAERMARYRFLFMDLSNMARRMPRLGRGMREIIQALRRTLVALLSSLEENPRLAGGNGALTALSDQTAMTLVCSLDYQRILGQEPEVGVMVYQAMMIIAPHLHSDAREDVEALARRYLP